MAQYNRERRCYTFESISKSPYIRAMVDSVGHDEGPLECDVKQPQCMVFEWMDTDLWRLPAKMFRSGSMLPRVTARSLLEALVVFDGEDGVHTDLNPNNVFLSGIDSSVPVVKLGDLGNCTVS